MLKEKENQVEEKEKTVTLSTLLENQIKMRKNRKEIILGKKEVKLSQIEEKLRQKEMTLNADLADLENFKKASIE